MTVTNNFSANKKAQYRFEVTGGFDVVSNLKTTFAADGAVISFTNHKNQTIRLVVALEVETPGKGMKYYTSQTAMEELGFDGLVYDQLDFIPIAG